MTAAPDDRHMEQGSDVRGTPAEAGRPTGAESFTGRRSVTVGLVVAIAQTVALAVAAVVTGSAALKTQTATNGVDYARTTRCRGGRRARSGAPCPSVGCPRSVACGIIAAYWR